MADPRRSPRPAKRPADLTIARYPYATALNPYQGLLYQALADEGVALAPDRPFTARALVRMQPRVGVLHFNWRLDRLHGSSPARWRIALARLRLRFADLLGYRIAWTIHELASRDGTVQREPMEAALSQIAAVFFCHDPDLADRAALELGIDRSRIDVVPHGPLAVAYPPARITRERTRERLGIAAGETVFLAFGVLREYKQLDLLLSAFSRVRASGVRLVIAGDPVSAPVIRALQVAAAADRRVVLLDRRIPEVEIRELFAASDVFVSARCDGWTSGSLVLALNLGLPAIVAACPAYVRLLAGGRAGWSFDPIGGEEALATRLDEVVGMSEAALREAGVVAADSSFEMSWDDTAMRLARRFRGSDEPRRLALDPDVIDA